MRLPVEQETGTARLLVKTGKFNTVIANSTIDEALGLRVLTPVEFVTRLASV
jgi:hypothetical protein